MMAEKRIAILYVGQNHIGATHLCYPGQTQYKFDGQFGVSSPGYENAIETPMESQPDAFC